MRAAQEHLAQRPADRQVAEVNLFADPDTDAQFSREFALIYGTSARVVQGAQVAETAADFAAEFATL